MTHVVSSQHAVFDGVGIDVVGACVGNAVGSVGADVGDHVSASLGVGDHVSASVVYSQSGGARERFECPRRRRKTAA